MKDVKSIITSCVRNRKFSNCDNILLKERTDNTMGKRERTKRKDRQHNGQKRKDKKNKQLSTKHCTENKRSSNTNPVISHRCRYDIDVFKFLFKPYHRSHSDMSIYLVYLTKTGKRYIKIIRIYGKKKMISSFGV